MNNPKTNGGTGSLRLQRFEHDAMACTFALHVADSDARHATGAARAAFDEVDRLERLLSRFIPHSEIAQLGALPPGRALRVSPETLECLQIAAEVYTETGGAFDIAFRSLRARDDTDVRAAAPPLVFDPRAHAVGVTRPGVTLDLGALGKGYAVDRVVALLREWGIRAALVHSGQSSVYALGHPPDAPAWRIALRHPDRTDESLGTLDLCDGALSGSGQRLHGGHIVDPQTGRPAAQAEAAWAVALTAALSDAFSTAFMIMSPAAIAALCGRRRDVSAILRPAAAKGQELVCFGPNQPGR